MYIIYFCVVVRGRTYCGRTGCQREYLKLKEEVTGG
jgi:hypothetical protein